MPGPAAGLTLGGGYSWKTNQCVEFTFFLLLPILFMMQEILRYLYSAHILQQ